MHLFSFICDHVGKVTEDSLYDKMITFLRRNERKNKSARFPNQVVVHGIWKKIIKYPFAGKKSLSVSVFREIKLVNVNRNYRSQR